MSNIELREQIIQCLLATSGQSEGVTADAILSLTQQEAEPVGEVREWNKNGSGAFKELIGIDKLNDGDKLYLHPPKPAALPQPHSVKCISAGVWESMYQCECGKCFTVNTENSTGSEQCPNAQPVASVPQDDYLTMPDHLRNQENLRAEREQGLEEFIAAESFYVSGIKYCSAGERSYYGRVVPVDALSARMAGNICVPSEVAGILRNAPELNTSNYDHDQVCRLNAAVIEAYSLIAASQGG